MRAALKQLAGILVAVSWLTSPASAEILIVTNAKNPLATIALDDVRKIYLGKTRTFPDNMSAVPVDQDSSNHAYAEFLTKVIGKSEKEMKAYWSVRIFTGRGTPPSRLESDNDVINWLRKNPEGIGYINASAANESVKVLLRIP